MHIQNKLITGLCAALLSTSALAGFTTQNLNDGLTPEELANTLAGAGVTVSNVIYTGVNNAAGTFSGGGDIVGIESGVILTSGDVAHIIGPNVESGITQDNEGLGDSDLDGLSGFGTYDATVLEFDFVPEGDHVSFHYVFGSDEYNEYVNSPYNDVFAFYVNGENCAVVPGTGDSVSINTINNGPAGDGVDATNPELYVDNTSDGETPAPYDTEIDGFTLILDCPSGVTPNETNHIKLAIADASDRILDSWVLLEMGSFTVPEPEPEGECVEDGLLPNGVASKLVHDSVEPLVGGLNPNLQNFTHKVNCWPVVPVEDSVDVLLDKVLN